MGVIDRISRDELLIIGFWGLFAVGLLVLTPLALRRLRQIERYNERRLHELDAWATAWQWTMNRVGSRTAAGGRITERLLAALPTLMRQEMQSGHVGVLLTGVYGGRPITVADYAYNVYTDTGVGSGTNRFTIVEVQMPDQYPAVRIVKRWVGSRLWRALARRHRARIGSPKFDHRFRVAIEERVVAEQLLGLPLVDLLADSALRLLDLRSQNLLLVWRGSVDVAKLAVRLDAASSIAELIERAATGSTPAVEDGSGPVVT